MDALYAYTLDWSKGSKRQHLDGERTFIERYIRLDEFDSLFGGKILLVDASGKSEFVGVWGRQATSRFKRVLKERGAEFVIQDADANNRVVKSYTQYYAEPKSHQRV
jgi:ASC-1-like (ASCH) protein